MAGGADNGFIILAALPQAIVQVLLAFRLLSAIQCVSNSITGSRKVSSTAFSIMGFCVLLTAVGTVAVVNPRAIPRLVNAYYSLIHMKTRLAEEDYDKVSIRFVGGFFIVIAIYVIINRWSELLK